MNSVPFSGVGILWNFMVLQQYVTRLVCFLLLSHDVICDSNTGYFVF